MSQTGYWGWHPFSPSISELTPSRLRSPQNHVFSFVPDLYLAVYLIWLPVWLFHQDLIKHPKMSSQSPIPSFFFSFVQCRKPPTSTPFYFNFFFLATVKPSGNQGIFWTFLDSPRHVPSMESYMWLSVSGFVHLACFPGSLVLSIAILGYFVCRSHTVLLIQHPRATSLVCSDC